MSIQSIQVQAMTRSALSSSASHSSVSGIDFGSILGDLFGRSIYLLQQYNDPDVTEIEFGNGLAPVKKSDTTGLAMAMPVALSQAESQLNSELGFMQFLYQTFPQKLNGLFG